MQLGIHLGAFSQPSLEEKLDAVASHGLACVHFNFKAVGLPSMPEEIDDALISRIAREMAARRLSVASLSGTFNMIHPDREVRREGLRRLEAVAAAARPLETGIVTLCTGTRDPHDMWRSHPDNCRPEAWRDLRESLDTAIAIAERHDVMLGIEPEVSNVVDSAQAARRLLDEVRSPRLGVIMDGANLFARGTLGKMREVLDRAFELLGPEIVVGHAKDLDADGRAGRLAAGWGVLDYDHYLALFRNAGFQGPLILHSLAEPQVADAVAFLREVLERFE
jgi:sugar phosphate isomerase/epimerase